MQKSTKKRARSQGRKSAVVIPAIPELDEHANAIRALGRRSFDDLCEIGKRVKRCRELLKVRRVYLAWIKLEFGWSRAHADNLIALHVNRRKLQKFSTLPVSALYLLAKASDKLTEKIAQDIAAGGRPLVRDIKQQARAESAAITMRLGPSRTGGARMHITSKPEEPTRRGPILTGGDLHRAATDYQAKGFSQELAGFARYVGNLLAPDAIAAALPAERRTTVIKDTDAVVSFLNELRRALWEAGRPKLVGKEE